MMQGFEWYSEGGGKHWKMVKDHAKALGDMGITAIWLPRACWDPRGCSLQRPDHMLKQSIHSPHQGFLPGWKVSLC